MKLNWTIGIPGAIYSTSEDIENSIAGGVTWLMVRSGNTETYIYMLTSIEDWFWKISSI